MKIKRLYKFIFLRYTVLIFKNDIYNEFKGVFRIAF